MRIVMMAVGWWAGGFVLCHVLMIKVGDPCPCPKCWLASVLATAYGLGYYYLLGFKAGFSTPEYFLSVLIAAVIGGAIGRAICPIKLS